MAYNYNTTIEIAQHATQVNPQQRHFGALKEIRKTSTREKTLVTDLLVQSGYGRTIARAITENEY